MAFQNSGDGTALGELGEEQDLLIVKNKLMKIK